MTLGPFTSSPQGEMPIAGLLSGAAAGTDADSDGGSRPIPPIVPEDHPG